MDDARAAPDEGGSLPEEARVTEPVLRKTEVDLAGLFAVLAEHLYSTPQVAVRELLQNAHDACTRRRLEDPDAPPPRIRVTVQDTPPSIVFEDNGAGLTADEIVAYLATVGRGYTRELRASSSSAELIGLFGLGFLSAFVVAERVTVRTTSYRSPSEGVVYRSRDGQHYSLDASPAGAVGTVVELVLKPGFVTLSRADVLGELLGRYGCLLPVPIVLDDAPINAEAPPWHVSRPDEPARWRRAALAFAGRFEQRFEPITVMPVEPGDHSDVRGVLWVQDGASYGSSDNRDLAVFVRGMLLDDDARDLLPPWAGFVSGVVASDALIPTASREDLKRDDAYRACRDAIARSLVDGMVGVARHEPEAFRRVLSRHNEALLGATLASDALFEALASHLTVPTTEGDLDMETVRARAGGRFHVGRSDQGGFEEVLFRALKIPVLVGSRFAVLPFARKYAARRGGDVLELGTAAANRAVFEPVTLDAAASATLARCLGTRHHIAAARFTPSTVPLVVVVDREAEVRARLESDAADKRIAAAALSLARLHARSAPASPPTTLYVNVASRPIAALLARPDRVDASHPAAVVLRSLIAFVEGSGNADGNFAQALEDLGDVVATLLADEGRQR